MITSYAFDGGLNIINNTNDITDFATYSVGLSDSIVYSTDAAPHEIWVPLAAQAGVGKTITFSPLFGWSYEIHFQGSDSTNGLPATNPVFTSNSSVQFTSNGVDIWILNSGVLTD